MLLFKKPAAVTAKATAVCAHKLYISNDFNHPQLFL